MSGVAPTTTADPSASGDSSRTPGSTTTACPRRNRPGAAPRQTPPATQCYIVSASASCSHGDGARVVSTMRDATQRGAPAQPAQALGVVPDDKSFSGDVITLKAEMSAGKCERHPQWTILQGSEKQEARGTTTTFRATGWKLGKPWCPRATPKRYDINVLSCNGGPHRLKVHSYPGDKVSIEFNTKEFAPRFGTFLERMNTLFKSFLGEFWGEHAELTWLEGTGKWESQWTEHCDHRAFYKYAISIGFNPLLGAEFKLPLARYPLPVPSWLADCAVYFKLSGQYSVNLQFSRTTPDFADHMDSEAPLVGQLQASLSAELKAGDGALMLVCLEASSGVALESKGVIDDRGFGLQGLELKFNGLTGSFHFQTLWGAVHYAYEVQLVGPATIGSSGDRYYLNELLANKLRGGSLARI